MPKRSRPNRCLFRFSLNGTQYRCVWDRTEQVLRIRALRARYSWIISGAQMLDMATGQHLLPIDPTTITLQPTKTKCQPDHETVNS